MEGSVERKEGYVITKINNKCNSLCNFCADDWNVRNKPDPSFADIKEQLDNGVKQGFHKLIITGGEPTISPILFRVIDYARSIGYDTIYLTTNGRALSIEHFFNKIIKVIDRFLVSFFEFYPEVYDDIAGVKSYLQVLTGLKRLSRVNKDYMVNAVITKQNYTHMRELLILLISLNAKHIQFSFLNPVGFARRFKDKVLINYKDVIPYVYEVIKTAEYLNFKNFSFENFPVCVFGQDYKRVLPYLSDLKHPRENKEYYSTGKYKPEECKRCKFNDVCEGIFYEYYKLFGDSELNPIE